jgi:hypothetical protein
MHILLKCKRTGREEWLPLERAAELMDLAADEIEAALEEHGELERRNWIALDQDW